MATIEKRGDSYRIRVSCGYDINGKQLIKRTTWTPDSGMTQKQIEKELKRQVFLYEEKIKTGRILDDNIRFSVFSETWMTDHAQKQCAPKTIKRYKELLVRINKAIGHMKLCEIQPHHLSQFYDNLGENGVNIKTGGGLSKKTIQHHHRLISSILGTAVTWQILFSNPASRVKPPKVERKEAVYLEDYEVSKLLDCLQIEPIQYRTMIILLLHSGLRRGELCGLEWKDLDFKNCILVIRRASQYLPEDGIFTKDPKTGASIRTMKLPVEVFNMLEDYRRHQNKERLKLGDRWEENDRLFTQLEGKPIHPDTITDWFKKFLRKNNLPDINVHSLRHTNASLMIFAGVPISTVAKRLGHAQISTTSNIYAHALRSSDEIASEAIGNILSFQKKDTDCNIV